MRSARRNVPRVSLGARKNSRTRDTVARIDRRARNFSCQFGTGLAESEIGNSKLEIRNRKFMADLAFCILIARFLLCYNFRAHHGTNTFRSPVSGLFFVRLSVPLGLYPRAQ